LLDETVFPHLRKELAPLEGTTAAEGTYLDTMDLLERREEDKTCNMEN
jgi:hypothetical protein